MRRLWWLSCAWAIGCGSSVKVPPPQPGELIGSVQISTDVPATGCQVLLEGTPLGGRCDETGTFDVRNVPPGRWDLRIVIDGAANALPARRVAAGSNPGQVTNLGAVALAKAGAIGGHVKNGAASPTNVLAVPELGVVSAPNDNGGYLLDGVSPGVHEVVLITDDGTVVRDNVTVLPGKVTIGADFDLGTKTSAMVAITGHSRRADKGDGEHAGITVDLVEDLDGKTITSAQTKDDGSFQLMGQPGTYILRAHDGTSPITAIVPSLVLKAGGALDLGAALVIYPQHGDLNGNGIPDDMDPDIDGDGVLNADDAFPYDPAEWKDTDGDGVGDRADLKSMGGNGVDHKNATPDTDGDGLLDFEDNCPKDFNPDQWDPDGDGVGTLKNMTSRCDNCPFVFNPDQKDSVGNGVGDACRACHQNSDCGAAGQICQFGQCVDCLTNTQCGQLVCQSGKCVACTKSSDCSAGNVCSVAGRCVQCVSNSDCAVNQQCVTNSCFNQCSNDTMCPGGYCVSGVCAACRNNADCPTTQYCAQGACHPQCTVNANCPGVQICDPATKTCVTPCSAMCPSGQACDSTSTCRALCDASRPCPTGMKCSAQSLCVPQCATNPDCTVPHTVCSAGQCVPDGTCTLDTDCTTDKMCIGGICTTRPTTLVAGKGYTCASACDCRMGEACLVDAGDGKTYCKPDPVPTWFVSASGNGNGKSPSTPVDINTVLTGIKAGDVVAIKAGDTVSSSGQTVAVPIALSGGWAVCGPNRWVRDPGQRSTVGTTTTSVTTPINASGTASAPLTGLSMRNLIFAPSYVGSNAAQLIVQHAPNLALDSLTFQAQPGGGNAFWGLSVVASTSVSITNVDSPGASAAWNAFNFMVVDQSSGVIDHAHLGPVGGSGAMFGITVSNTAGAFSMTNTQCDRFDVSNGAVILAQNAAGGLLTVSGSQLPWDLSASRNATGFAAIQMKNTPAFLISNNLVDGRTGTVTGVESGIDDAAIYVDGSAGTIDKNTIYYPNANVASSYLAIWGTNLTGPTTVTNNVASGGTVDFLYLAYFGTAPTNALLTFANNTLSSTALQGAYGLYLGGIGAFVVTDNTITLNGTQTITSGNYRATALYVDAGASGRIERNRFVNNMTLTDGNASSGGYFFSGSSTEVYDNWFVGGTSGQAGALSAGIILDGPGQSFPMDLIAIGNTLYAGGKAGGAGWSCGLSWGNGTGFTFTSNLIDAGIATGQRTIMCGGNFNPGGVIGNFHNNYLQTSATTNATASSAPFATLADGMTDANGNIMGDRVSCFDPANTQPNYHLLAGGPCIDKGVAGTRRDTTVITQDVDKMPRVLGAAADIGCSEKQ